MSNRTAEPPKGQGERILYLDDEEALVFLVTRMLKALGYQPTGFSRAAEALEAFRRAPEAFSLVLTDLSMPGMSGMDFAREVLAISSQAPVVIASGAITPTDIEKATALGVRAVIQKPGTVEEMGQAVRQILSQIAASDRP